MNETTRIRVAILDDNQGIINGYGFRLDQAPDIEVVATTTFGETLEAILARHHPDLLILDVFVPTSAKNPAYYPVLQAIPRWLQLYPHLSILVITAYPLRTLITAAIRAGASGVVLKDDQETIGELAEIIRTVARGDRFFSKKIDQRLLQRMA